MRKEVKKTRSIKATDMQWKHICADCELIKEKMNLQMSDALELALQYLTTPMKLHDTIDIYGDKDKE